MSYRTFTQTAIDCDSCDEIFYDSCETSAAYAMLCATKHHGWKANDDGTHTCPKCINDPEHLAKWAEIKRRDRENDASVAAARERNKVRRAGYIRKAARR